MAFLERPQPEALRKTGGAYYIIVSSQLPWHTRGLSEASSFFPVPYTLTSQNALFPAATALVYATIWNTIHRNVQYQHQLEGL